MRINDKVRTFFGNMFAWIRYIIDHTYEIKKYTDPRRVSIYKKIQLTDSQKRKIDSLYIENYGKKVPHIWHRHFTDFTGNFDEKYIPELLYIPEFEAFMNINPEYNKVFSDKNVLPYIAKTANVKVPETIISCIKGVYRNKENNIITKKEAIEVISNIGSVFIKPSVDSNSGKNCAVLNVDGGIDKVSGRTVAEIIESIGLDFLVQEKVICHKSISDIYPDSVNTFRIITYIWRDEIKFMPVIMRIGRGGNCIDNAHAGGMFIAVDDDGTLHDTAFTEFNNRFSVHPDTKISYKGYKIECFSNVLSAAKAMHELIPQVGVVNWDFTIDETGAAVIIEMNINSGSVWLPQIAHGKGAFGDNTAEVLRWLALMKKTTPSKRYKYAFGKFE